MTIMNTQLLYEQIIGKGKVQHLGFKPADYVAQSNELEYLVWQIPNALFKHYTCGDGHGKLFYDPWKGGSNSARNGKMIEKRITKIL